MIYNQSQKYPLVTHHKKLYGLLEQAFGLMFRKPLHDTAWVFICPYTARWDITNLFVFQTIDVLWLDNHFVVQKKAQVRPFTLHQKGHPGTKYFIELPKDAAKKVQLGDTVVFDKKAL